MSGSFFTLRSKAKPQQPVMPGSLTQGETPVTERATDRRQTTCPVQSIIKVTRTSITTVKQYFVCVMTTLFHFVFIFFHFSQMWSPTLFPREIAFCALFTLPKHRGKLVTQCFL